MSRATLHDPPALPHLAAALADLGAFAQEVNAARRASHYRFADRSKVELVLLYEMLKAVGCDERDEVLLALVEHKATRERSGARYRSKLRRDAEGGGKRK